MNPSRTRVMLVAAAATVVAVAASACSAGEEATAAPRIVATTSILGDVVESITRGEAEVLVLIPRGADPHDYRPSAAQIAELNRADLVVANGLGLEEGLADVLAAAGGDGVAILEIAPMLAPQPFATGGNPELLDPHVWLDPVRMADASLLIGAALETAAPGVDWATPAEEYAASLLEVDGRIAATLAAVETPRRKLVTNHDSMGYFAARYGFTIIGAVVPSGTTLGDPSSADLTALIDLLRREGVATIFAETTQPDALARAVADELGADVRIVELHSGSLGDEGTDADTLAGLLLSNARLIAAALDR